MHLSSKEKNKNKLPLIHCRSCSTKATNLASRRVKIHVFSSKTLLMLVVVWLTCCILVEDAVVTVAAEEGSDDHHQSQTIDGCALVAKQNSTQVVANCTAIPHTFLHFVDCAILPNTDITIIASQSASGSTSSSKSSLTINILNTTMQGGSLTIIPAASRDSGSSAAVLLVEHVTISVKNSALQARGDILMLKVADEEDPRSSATISLCRNVSMVVENVLMTSVEGSVASIVSNREDSTVEDASIAIRGNSTLQAKYLIASIQTSRVVNCQLIARGSCAGGITINAGGAAVMGQVAALSVLPIATTGTSPRPYLHIDTLLIQVVNYDSLGVDESGTFWRRSNDYGGGTSSSSSARNPSLSSLSSCGVVMRIITVVKQGVAAIASIAVAHEYRAELKVTGNVSIDIQLEGSESRNEDVHSSSSDEMEGVNASHIMKASSGVASAVGVGGIIVIAYSRTSLSQATFLINDCHLRVSLMAQNINSTSSSFGGNTRSLVLETEGESQAAAAVLGIAMMSSSSTYASYVTLAIVNGSHVAVTFSATDCENVTLRFLPGAVNDVSTTVLGLSMLSYSFNGLSKMVLSLQENSRLTFASSAARCNHLSFSSGMKNHVASSVMGIAAYCFSSSSTAIVKATMNDGGVSILSSFSQCNKVFLTSTITGNYGASTVLGLAILGDSRPSSPTRGIDVINDASNITIASSLRDCGTVSLSSYVTSRFASSVLGIAIFNQLQNPMTAFILQKGSLLTLGFSAHGCNSVSISSSAAGHHVALSVLAVAVNSQGMNSATMSFTLQHQSGLVIASAISNCRNVELHSWVAGNYGAASILGVTLTSSSFKSSTPVSLVNGSTLAILYTATNVSSHIIACTTMRASSASILGVSIYNQPGFSPMYIGSTCKVSINAILQGTSATVGSVGSPSATALCGICISGSTGTALLIHDETVYSVNQSLQHQVSPNLELWVGAVNSSVLKSTTNSGAHSTVVGMMPHAFSGFNRDNTALSFCSDGTTRLTTPTYVALKTEPRIPQVHFNITYAWALHSHPVPLDTSMDSSCSEKAHQTVNTINRTVMDALSPWQLPTWWRQPDRVEPPPITSTRSLVVTSSRTKGTPTETPTYPLSSSLPRNTTTLSPSRGSSSPTNTALPIASPTISPTLTMTIQPHTASPLPPTQPPPKQRTVKITTSVLMPDNEQAATVVLSTAGASGAVGSTLGSGGGGMVVTAGSSVRMMECGLADDDPRPASFELPIQFAVGSVSTRYFAGASLAHTLLQCFFLAVPVLLRRVSKSGSRGSRNAVMYLSMLFCGAHAFFTPAILGACSTVLNNDDDGLSLAVAGCCVLVLVGVHGAVVLAVHRGPQNGLVARATHGHAVKFEFDVMTSTDTTSSSISATSFSSSDSSDDDTSSTDSRDSIASTRSRSYRRPSTSSLLFSGHATKDILLTLFDGCRIFEKASHRHYASIETTLYSIIAVISGARPKENCAVAAFAIGALAAVQLLYIVVIRPFRTRLDTIFSLLNALVLVVLSLAVAVSVQKRSSEDAAPDEWVLKTVEACLWLISVLGYTQLVLQGYWTYHVHQRRVYRERREAELRQVADINGDVPLNDDGSVDEDSLNDPLLVVMEMEERPTLTAPAPSDASEHDGVMNPLTKHRGLRK